MSWFTFKYPLIGQETVTLGIRTFKLEVGGASRDPTGFGALEEGLISS